MKNMFISLVACLGFSFSVIASDFTLHQESFNSSDFGNIQNYMDEQNPDNVSHILVHSSDRSGLYQGRFGGRGGSNK